MIPKPLNDITFRDLTKLIEAPPRERPAVRYWTLLPALGPNDYRLLSDVTSFANEKGGDVIFGIAESDQKTIKIVGLDSIGLDDAMLRLQALLELWVSPRLSYEMTRISAGDNRQVVILRIHRAPGQPHAVTMAERSAPARSLTAEERIERYVRRRVVDIAGGRTPVPMLTPLSGARVAIHLVPQLAFDTAPPLALTRLYRSPGRLQPMCNLRSDAEDWDSTEMPDGLVTYSYGSNPSPRAYAHLSVTGIVEAVNVRIYGVQKNGHWIVSMHSVEESLIMSTRRYLRFQKDLGIKVPISLFLSWIGVQGAIVPTREAIHSNFARAVPIAQPVVFSQCGVFHDYSEAVDAHFKAPLDTLYKLCGADSAEHFDARGKWQRFL